MKKVDLIIFFFFLVFWLFCFDATSGVPARDQSARAVADLFVCCFRVAIASLGFLGSDVAFVDAVVVVLVFHIIDSVRCAYQNEVKVFYVYVVLVNKCNHYETNYSLHCFAHFFNLLADVYKYLF